MNYHNIKKSWMTSAIFSDFLVQWDKKLTENIVLDLDNCAVHPTHLILQHIKLVFLPPNTTSIIELLDQEIINSFKCCYKKELAKKVVTAICLSPSSSVSTAAKSVNLLDAMHYIKMSWTISFCSVYLFISAETLFNHFNHGRHTYYYPRNFSQTDTNICPFPPCNSINIFS